MGRKGIEFDHSTFSFKQATTSVWRMVRSALIYMLGTLTLAVLFYIVAALFFSTDVEKRLKKENKRYKAVYEALVPKAQILEDAVAGLQYKDNDLYEQVFHSSAPEVDPMGEKRMVFASDTVPDRKILSYTRDKADVLLGEADSVDAAFDRIIRMLSDDSRVLPPMSLPLEEVAYYQVGASVGKRLNPLFKAYVNHDGLDFMVPRGSAVIASADGVVKSASNSHSDGRTVVIEHEGGYQTRYSHLETMKVRQGQRVSRGQQIGAVGMSGNSFAPHLHYSVYKDEVCVDPVNYIFASVTPEEYAKILYMAVNTVQSMD